MRTTFHSTAFALAALFAASGGGCNASTTQTPATRPAPRPTDSGPLFDTPARWMAFPQVVGTPQATLVLDDGTCLVTTDDGQRWLVQPKDKAQPCVGTGRASEGFGTTPFEGQVFFNNQPGSVGNLGRAIVSGPWYFNVDASLVKNIRITEGSRIQLRMEAFNALNRAHFFPANWILNITSPNFGRLTQTGGNSGGPGGARVVQFAARFEF